MGYGDAYSAERSDDIARTAPSGDAKSAVGALPLLHSQRALWLDVESRCSPSHHISGRLVLLGVLDCLALRAALERVAARHEALRTNFVLIDSAPHQLVQSTNVGFDVLEHDVEANSDIVALSLQETLQPFDLLRGRPIRSRLVRLAPHKYVLFITAHRIVADAASLWILIREVAELYNALLLGRDDPLPPAGPSYVDHILAQRQQAIAHQLDRQLEYWKHTLANTPPILQLPTDFTRRTADTYVSDVLPIKLPTVLVRRLAQFARVNHISLLETLLSAWAIVLGRWCNQDEVIIGTRLANRNLATSASLIGPLENTIALRITMAADVTVAQFLEQVNQVYTGACSHSDISLDAVTRAISPSRSGNPLFQTQLSIDDRSAAVRLARVKTAQAEVRRPVSPFVLSLSLSHVEGSLAGELEYARDLLRRETAERIAACWIMLLKGMIKHARRTIACIAMLPGTERAHVLYGFKGEEIPAPRYPLIHTLFEEQVARAPDATALMHHDRTLTYATLDRRANQLARFLKSKGVGANQLVGICIERSLEMVVGLLGIMKAGAAYVPLDPNYPAERLAHMLEDASPQVVLTDERSMHSLPRTAVELIDVKSSWERIERSAESSLSIPQKLSQRPNRVYVIYTSGSTGKPKGVDMSHRAMCNLIEWHRRTFSANEGKRVLQFAALSFDVAFQETFTTLCTGGALTLLDEWMRYDPAALMQLLSHKAIERVFVPPLVLQNLAQFASASATDALALQDVITAGEQLRITPEIAGFFGRLNGCRLHNHYGPTESHVVTALTLTGNPRDWPALPSIGRPIANTQIYILDSNRQPVPAGVIGEIYIGGANVASGYLNRADLTAERFIADPFLGHPQGRLYRSGDLGRWRSDGTLEYLGRNDDQVKVRGFRIEPADIETQLTRHAGVQEAVVIAREDNSGDKRLVAYITWRSGSNPGVEELRRFLQTSLPDHMVPSAFVALQRLPLTPSGKVDRRALPRPDESAYVIRPYEAPRGEIEQVLATIWEQLLRVPRVGRHDNFFELGGDSLRIAQMMDRLRKRGFSPDIRDVFRSRSLADLGAGIAFDGSDTLAYTLPPSLIPSGCEAITPQMLPLIELHADDLERITRVVPGGAPNIQDIYPLSPLQEGLLFHHLLKEEDSDAYVLQTLLSLPSRESLDALISALQSVIVRHDALRTAVLWEDLPRPVQVVQRYASLPVETMTLDADGDPLEQIKEWMTHGQHRMDLRRAPLMGLHVAPAPSGTAWYALLQLHHIIGDNTSEEILSSEVIAALEQHDQALPTPAPYRNHVARSLAEAQEHDAERFFRSKLADVDEPTAPFGLIDTHGDGSHIAEARETLDPDLSSRVRQQARRLNIGPATLFHAAWALVLARTSARDDVVFGTVLLGHLQASSDAQQMFGMFINTLPVRLRLEGLTATGLIEQMQGELVDLIRHEQAPLALAQRCSGMMGSAPLFTTLLNYRHSMPSSRRAWTSVGRMQMLAHYERTNYPITLSIDDVDRGFDVTAQIDRSLDPTRVTAYLRSAIGSLVRALEQAPHTPALEISVMPVNERQQILDAFNSTQLPYPHEKLIHQLFEEQASLSPRAIAVESKQQALTYAQVNARSNHLARQLLQRGVRPDHLVGICVERSVELVVGLLGILKAGGTYLPIDPNYPADRIVHMIQDGAPELVLTQTALQDRLPPMAAERLALDAISWQDAELDKSNLPASLLGLTPRHLLYVIYTSGSTGRPKGTAMTHGAMVNLISWHRGQFDNTPGRRVAQFAALSFDVAFQEIFSTLCTGNTLVLLNEEVRRDPAALTEFLISRDIERLFVPPLMLQSLAEHCEASAVAPRTLRDVIVAGEQLRVSGQIQAFFKRLRHAQLHNHYGPTETHVVTALTLQGDPDEWPTLPSIGRPIANTQVYLLDRQRQPVPIGVPGEIWIGGISLARGYLNRPELTAERFRADPFSSYPRARLYRTGDLGRWHPDGRIEYLGRNDNQVKIRGYRVELGEIEAQLTNHEQVREAAVIAREDAPGQKRLIAYVVSNDIGALDTEQLHAHLKETLPDHMIPSAFVVLDRLPLTPSGKLDRRALPTPSLESYRTQRYEAPQGEMEEIVADLWQQLLDIERVGRNDNFFDLGGHSLLAMQVAVRLRSHLSIDVPISSLFENPTPMRLAAYMEPLRQARLLAELESSDGDIQDLLEEIASMPEARVRELLKGFAGGRS